MVTKIMALQFLNLVGEQKLEEMEWSAKLIEITQTTNMGLCIMETLGVQPIMDTIFLE